MVSEDSITAKGRCVENVGSRYIMEEEEKGGEKCWRCMNIYRKHENVLQYKESELFSVFLYLYCESCESLFQVIARHIWKISTASVWE